MPRFQRLRSSLRDIDGLVYAARSADIFNLIVKRCIYYLQIMRGSCKDTLQCKWMPFCDPCHRDLNLIPVSAVLTVVIHIF